MGIISSLTQVPHVLVGGIVHSTRLGVWREHFCSSDVAGLEDNSDVTSGTDITGDDGTGGAASHATVCKGCQ